MHSDFSSDFGKLKCFRYRGRKVTPTPISDFLIVSIEGQDDEQAEKLINKFSEFIGYSPFCKYTLTLSGTPKLPPLTTYEWDKINPDSRFQNLCKRKSVSNLTKLL
jgi:hypothetical protein